MSKFEEIVREIVFDSPPEEIPLVYNNLQVLSNGDSKQEIISIIQEFNEKVRVPVKYDGENYVLSEYNKSGSKYFDPVKKVLFSVDPVSREVSDVEELQEQELVATDVQDSLYGDLSKYVSKAFPETAAYGVFKTKKSENEYAIVIVSNKKSLGDFWTGNWVSEYIYNADSDSISGKVSVDAHYFEDGNVRFKSSAPLQEETSTSPVVSIKRFENNFENNLIEKFQYMNETQFKGLRRRLPVTRAKINWGQGIGNYRLGRDAAQGTN